MPFQPQPPSLPLFIPKPLCLYPWPHLCLSLIEILAQVNGWDFALMGIQQFGQRPWDLQLKC